MTFEEAVEQYRAKWAGGPSLTRVQGFADGWNAATAEAEKRAKEREADARLEEAKAWHHIVTQDTDGISLSLYQWATDRLREAKDLAARPASGEVEGKEKP